MPEYECPYETDYKGALTDKGMADLESAMSNAPPFSDLSFARTEAKCRNWRGMSTSEVVYELLYHRARRDQFGAELETPIPEVDTEPYAGAKVYALSPEEALRRFIENRKEHIVIENVYIGACLQELDRRDKITISIKTNPSQHVIQAIKDRIPIANVLEWYTDVFYRDKAHFTFRCKLHGEDTTPSGVIYSDEKRWYCFGCNQGGDVFDAVQAFERVDIKQAISKLARYVGIENSKPVKIDLHPKPDYLK